MPGVGLEIGHLPLGECLLGVRVGLGSPTGTGTPQLPVPRRIHPQGVAAQPVVAEGFHPGPQRHVAPIPFQPGLGADFVIGPADISDGDARIVVLGDRPGQSLGGYRLAQGLAPARVLDHLEVSGDVVGITGIRADTIGFKVIAVG